MLLDSVNLKNSTFSDETPLLLHYLPGRIGSPRVAADTAEFFHVNKPERGWPLPLLDANRRPVRERSTYGYLTQPLEVWIDRAKKESKTQREDSYTWLAKSPLAGGYQQQRLVIKLLASAEDKADAFKSGKTGKSRLTAYLQLQQRRTRRIDIKDMLEGKIIQLYDITQWSLCAAIPA